MSSDRGKVVSRLMARLFRRLLWTGMRGATRHGDDFTTFHTRPKRAGAIGTWRDEAIDIGTTAIVMQGPVATLNDFTLETFRLYKKHFAPCHLILSTWDDTPAAPLAAFRSLGVDVVLCQRPAHPGLFNLNMQIVTAARGVEHASRTGAKWILKTRTDQRLCEPNAISFLGALAMAFPVASGFDQKYRIIGVGQGSLKYAPYHLTDQTVFGQADDMLRYWTPPLREGTPSHWPAVLPEIYRKVPVGELCQYGAAESYFASQFLARVGRPLRWTLEDSWSAFKDHFCIADYSSTDFYWMKGQLLTYREFPTQYDCISTVRELSFREWFLLYTGMLSCASARQFEGALRSCFRDPVAK